MLVTALYTVLPELACFVFLLGVLRHIYGPCDRLTSWVINVVYGSASTVQTQKLFH